MAARNPVEHLPQRATSAQGDIHTASHGQGEVTQRRAGGSYSKAKCLSTAFFPFFHSTEFLPAPNAQGCQDNGGLQGTGMSRWAVLG